MQSLPNVTLHRLVLLLLSVVLTAPTLLRAQTLVNINQKGNDSFPSDLTVYDGKLYFTAVDGTSTNAQLWRYDASTGEATKAGGGANFVGSQPADLTVYDSKLFYGARGFSGAELRHYDASTDAFTVVRDFGGGFFASSPSGLAVYAGRLFFAVNGGSGVELWQYDAATGEATLAADINDGSHSFPTNLTVYEGKLFFRATDGTGIDGHGVELWQYDATTGEATLAADVNPGQASSISSNIDFSLPGASAMTVYDGKLFFSANDGTSGHELWRYDASTGEATRAADLVSGFSKGSFPASMTVYDGKLFFMAAGSEGRQVWQYDASTGEATVAVDSPASSDGLSLQRLEVYDGTLFFVFSVTDDEDQLWRYDAGTDQASLVRSFVPPVRGLTVYDDKLFFAAADDVNGNELWQHDAATDQTSLAANINPSDAGSEPEDLAVYDGELFFAAATGFSNDRRLWRYDATTGEATLAVPDLDGATDYRPSDLAVYDGSLFFTAISDATGRELWQYDATTEEATLAADIDPGSPHSSPAELTVYDGKLFFSATDGSGDTQLWQFDAATGEATLATPDLDGEPDYHPSGLTVYDGKLFFSPTDGFDNTDLAQYDAATGAATVVATGLDSLDPEELTVYGGRLFFTATGDAAGRELWQYDAATGEATLAADVRAGSSGSSPSDLTVYDGKLFFDAFSDATGQELWQYDAATGEATLAADIYPGSFGAMSSFRTGMAVFDDVLFFEAEGDAAGNELWQYDAATDEAHRVADIRTVSVSGVNGSQPRDFRLYDGRLFFNADDGVHGRELWFITPSEVLPVELASFAAGVDDGAVVLRWETASETNNAGFEIQRMSEDRGLSAPASWETLAFVEGHGTTTRAQAYRFEDVALPFEATVLRYRLRQIDYDGGFEYSPDVEVNLALPSAFALEAAYPNPFNPTTTIRYALPQAGEVRLVVYDVLGREVAVLVDGVQQAGRHAVVWEAAGLSSGTYLYRIEAGAFQQARQMLLVK